MTDLTREIVRTQLKQRARDEPVYLKAREIAAEVDASTKAVAYYLAELEGETNDIVLERWGRSKSTTWKLIRRQENP